MATIERTENPSPLEQWLSRVYTLNWELVIYIVIMIVAIVTRFWDLGERVMSHDESLHTYYSWELYDRGHFHHTPLMHGPLLFHATAFFYFLFGPNDFSARIYTALLGVLIVMFPLLLRRWLGRTGAIFVAVGLLISPMLLYYSRYIRHDIPAIFFAMVMVYALLQYIDGEQPRRPVWIAVFAGAMSLMMASKEVAFIYIAIFGSFLTLYWVLRMIQDISGFRQQDDGTSDEQSVFISLLPQVWWMPWLGHLFLLAGAVIVGFAYGEILNNFYVADSGPLPDNMTLNLMVIELEAVRILQLVLIMVGFLLLESVGFIRTLLTRGEAQPGLATMIANGLRHPRSTMMLIIAGTIIGGVMALWVIGVIDIIKPSTIFVETNTFGVNDIEVSEDQLWHFIEWTFVPIGLLLFVVTLIGALKRAAWQDILVILLVAILVMTVLVFAERHSHPPDESTAGPVAIDPNAESAEPEPDKDNVYIYVTWMLAGAAVAVILVTRLLTGWWDFLNRQPTFDILIVMGTLVLPWLSAFPLFWAGYTLDMTPFPRETTIAALVTATPFLMVSLAVGLSWNWRMWPIAVAVFGALFMVFFTTFFTNGNGVGTGMVGSLGYWLEQQDVRRGSQPQYYYTLIQLPVYEFLPMILASIAGFMGLAKVFDYRNRSRQELEHVAAASLSVEDEAIAAAVVEPDIAEELPGQDDLYWTTYEEPQWVKPYDHEQELSHRRSGDPEYLGAVPFLQFAGYWATMILVALTIAGEKMPWLTSHLTLPMVLVGGWYLGQVVEGLNPRTLWKSGWALLFVIVPVFFVALAQVILPYTHGGDLPFQGQTQAELNATGKWIAAFFVLVTTGYFALKMSVEVGWEQARRLFVCAGAMVLVVLTVRAAWMFSFVNYDYATEYGVYAHAGPAVKDVLDDLLYMADRRSEGMDIPIVYDDDSSWPMLWYLRDFDSKRYIWGTSEDLRNNTQTLDGVVAAIVGPSKNAEVERILGRDYYRFDMIRLWWPMQQYFNLDYNRVTNIFESNAENPAASLYRRGIWDIWWSRDYDRYAQAMCVERRANECYPPEQQELPIEEREFDRACIQRITNECAGDDYFDVEDWPVSQELYFYVHKDFAVQIWDAGLDGQSVAERLIPDPEDEVQQEFPASNVFGSGFLLEPRDLETDAAGNLYVADVGNDRIVIYAPDGTLLGEMGGAGILNEPWGVAVSPVNGNVYVADTWNHRVVVFSPEGEQLMTFGQFGSPDDGSPFSLYGPRDVDVDVEGNVYIADTGGHRIRIYDSQGQFVRDIRSNAQGLRNDAEPVGVVVHPVSGEIYVAETWNQQISVFRRDGTFVDSWRVNMWAGTRSSRHRPYLEISPDGTLILVSDMDASDTNNGPRVVAYDLRGNAIISFNAPLTFETGPSGAEIVAGMAFGENGQLYVADAATSRILVFDALIGISGSIQPVPDPTFGQNEIGVVSADVDDVEALKGVATAYWQALTSGNFELYRSLHCAADIAQPDFPLEEITFRALDAGPYIGHSAREVVPLVEVEGDTATVRWMGNLIFNPGTDAESRAVAASYPSLEVRKQGDVWQICSAPDIFRPGGG